MLSQLETDVNFNYFWFGDKSKKHDFIAREHLQDIKVSHAHPEERVILSHAGLYTESTERSGPESGIA